MSKKIGAAERAAMSQQWVRRLVSDWGGFEKLIAKLNETGDVAVEHNVTLIGKSGAPRQIDVLARHKQGLYSHLVVIECKFWKERISRLHVDSLVTTVREVNASRGVIFSVAGFESGAITEAQHQGIDLFKIREPTDEEWGLPGRHIDFYLTFVSRAFRKLTFPNIYTMGGATGLGFNLDFGEDLSASSKTEIQPIEGLIHNTLEELIIATIDHAAKELWPRQILFGGKEGERRFWKNANVKMTAPVVSFSAGRVVFIPEINFDIGLKITQTRFKFDRGAKFTFALAVEDCIKNIVSSATRERDEENTRIVQLLKEESQKSGVLVNGSILTVMLKGFFDFAEISDLKNGEFDDVIKGKDPE